MPNSGKKENFADILKKWENGTDDPKKYTMDEWLRNNEVYDKDAHTSQDGNAPQGGYFKSSGRGENRRRILRNRPDAVLDIHGLTNERAWIALDQFFTNAKDKGYKKLRIIHGKGNHSQGEAVLQSTVRKFIEKCPFAGESGYEKSPNGGTGATWVLLKNS